MAALSGTGVSPEQSSAESKNAISNTYYERRDLEDFPNIGEYAPEAGARFFDYYGVATSSGKLTERENSLIALDYFPQGVSWDYLTHEHARSRAYRWGEDGLLGISDRQGRLCFALALWNGRDPILKERLFGLTATEGNHGEDVKEEYFYLDSTPTRSYMKALNKYPQAEFPCGRLIEENRRRSLGGPEFELADTGVFSEPNAG